MRVDLPLCPPLGSPGLLPHQQSKKDCHANRYGDQCCCYKMVPQTFTVLRNSLSNMKRMAWPRTTRIPMGPVTVNSVKSSGKL